jgi:hypothetical protein
MCPTSEFPIVPAGSPTASPHASSEVVGEVFSKYLIGQEKEFFEQFNKQFLENGFICMNSKSYSFSIEYRINETDEAYLVRCYSERRKLKIVLKLRKFKEHINDLYNFSPEIKSLFLESTCKRCSEICNHRFSWIFEDSEYSACVYGDFDIKKYDKTTIKFIDEYVKLLCIERF